MSDGESDDGKRPSKKRKASRACDRCNTQHQPCDNASPKCSVCERAGTDCTYNRPVRKRGPRTGYTAQHGERLWGLILKASPVIEDLVLQVLADGTYGDTGVANADFFRNNDNQQELVSAFQESRIGRFVQGGDLSAADPVALERLRVPVPNAPSSVPCERLMAEPEIGMLVDHIQTSSKPSDSPGKSYSTAMLVSPHGAPQNPGDIYIQSDDIRRGVYKPDLSQQRYENELEGHENAATPDWLAFAVRPTGTEDSSYDLGEQSKIDRPMEDLSTNTLQQPKIGASVDVRSLHGDSKEREGDFDLLGASSWLESIPADTLLNLGFTAGEDMEDNFFALCENPDPVEKTRLKPVDAGEDEEVVWRRLVMQGRFS